VAANCPSTTDCLDLGHIATWWGKVNLHTSCTWDWTTDPDCTTGADVHGLAYCKKFYPSAQQVTQLSAVSPEVKPFFNAGCASQAPYAGQAEYVCFMCVPK
jgi:hypothetical protein